MLFYAIRSHWNESIRLGRQLHSIEDYALDCDYFGEGWASRITKKTLYVDFLKNSNYDPKYMTFIRLFPKATRNFETSNEKIKLPYRDTYLIQPVSCVVFGKLPLTLLPV